MALEKGELINGMKVSFLLKDAKGVTTYRVRDTAGMLKVLKQGVTDSELKWAHLSFLYNGNGRDYVLYRHVSGETLEKRRDRMGRLEEEEATSLTLDILRQLVHFHNEGLTYGNFYKDGNFCSGANFSADNILIEFIGERPIAYLCGLSRLSPVSNSELETDLGQKQNSEEFKDDLVGVARMISLMLEGKDGEERVQVKLGAPAKASLLEKVRDMAFARDFDSAQDMIDVLERKADLMEKTNSKGNKEDGSKKEGKGFAAVAGMTELKERLKNEVIDVLADKEGAQKYGIAVPNGMLLYGPPGCGKTFIAEKLAEETDYNYKYVKASDLGSTYIHGSQEKIAQLFDEARRQAPTIICFDEFDALVPCRDDVNHSSLRSEVNEFLTQLNNCGKDEIFVIATTNRPDKIDTAVLRSGRIDYIIYVPLPDEQAREEIFRINVNPRPHVEEIDYPSLAKLTEGYIASDITAIVQQASRKAFKGKELITMDLLKSIISERSPSLSKETIAQYERLRSQFESKNLPSSRKHIGFF